MNATGQNRLSGLLDRFPLAVSVATVAVGVLVLLGWLFDLEALKSVLPGLTSMKANTALGFILSGVSLWGTQTSRQGLWIVSQVCAGVVVVLGLLTLGEYLSGVNFGIDQLLIQEITNLPGDIPGRMAVNTALSFAALGAILLLLSQGKCGMVVAIHALAMMVIIAAGSALIGYAYDIEEFLRVKLNYTPMAVNTAAVFVLLALGVVNARPDYPFRRFITSNSAAGITMRRLLPTAIVFTLVTGWLILQGDLAGYFSTAFALALFTAVSIAGLGALILWNAGILYESDAQRERTEESLRENKEQLNTIIRILPVGLWVINGEGKIVLSNDAAQRIWAGVRYVGIDQLGEYKGWRLDSGRLVGPHEWAGARAIEKGETSIEEEIEIECFDGTHKIILDTAVPLRRDDGSISGAITMNYDITERKRAEEDVRTASLYVRSLIEASLDPLVTISPEGKVTDVNEATIRATGVAREVLIGSDFSEYFTEPEKARAGYREVFAKGFITDYPLVLRHVSGRIMEVLYNASVYRNDKGEVTGVFAAARDITERKRAEEELRKYHEQLEDLVRERTSELDVTNKDLESFAYSVSHDLRVPLRAIDGFSRLVLKRYEDKLDDEGKRLLNVVRDNTKRMGQLIDDILAFSRAGRLEIKTAEVDMEALARDVWQELEPSMAGREVRLDIKPLPKVQGDPAMLRQVWINLLGNAAKFTRPIPAAQIEIEGKIDGAECVFFVRDNGVGFDMEYVDKLFGVFQRLHGVDEFEGTGIGLAIIKRIITRHGGRVWAEGKVNEGATFYFALPILKES